MLEGQKIADARAVSLSCANLPMHYENKQAGGLPIGRESVPLLMKNPRCRAQCNNSARRLQSRPRAAVLPASHEFNLPIRRRARGMVAQDYVCFCVSGNVRIDSLLLVSLTIESLLRAFSHYLQVVLPGEMTC